MAHDPPSVVDKKANKRFIRALTGLVLMSASLLGSGCEPPENSVADPGFNPSAIIDPAVLPNATVILDRADVLAVAPAGVNVSSQVLRDIEAQFQPTPERSLDGRIQIVYLGPINFNISRNEGVRAGTVQVEDLDAYAQVHRARPGERVMWANLETGNLFIVNYPQPLWPGEDILTLEGFSPPPTPDGAVPVTQDFDFDWLRPSQYRKDSKGVLFGEETRQRVFQKDEPVEGKFFKRLLSLGGATGAMIGTRHFLTSAHVVAQYDPVTRVVKVMDLPIRAGRNGRLQAADTAKQKHVWWMADWTPGLSGIKRRSFDMAWGVMNRSLGSEVGYFGVMSAPATKLRNEGMTLRNAGYASCQAGHAPVPPDCLRRHIFMDSSPCEILGVNEPDAMGWGQVVAHSCDTNRGHNGSPLVVTEFGESYIWAVHSGAERGQNYGSRLTRNRHRTLVSSMFNRFPREE